MAGHRKRIASIKTALCAMAAAAFLAASAQCSAAGGQVNPPMTSEACRGMGFEEVRAQFEAAGFKKIKTKPVYDVIFGIFASAGDTESVKIDGGYEFTTSDLFNPKSKVVIKYHDKVSNAPDEEEAAKEKKAEKGKSSKGKGKKKKNKAEKTEEIQFTAFSAQEMLSDLSGNPYMAKEKYLGMYVAVEGYVDKIDINGKYVQLEADPDSWSWEGITCRLTDDSQKASLKDMRVGEYIRIRGKVTNIGSFGYDIDLIGN